jgi:hypothetical protein
MTHPATSRTCRIRQQREEDARASGLNHLPVSQAEAVPNHALLSPFAFRPSSGIASKTAAVATQQRLRGHLILPAIF